MLRRRPALIALVLACLLVPSTAAWAGEPPNQNDPCSRAGKDSCGTTGVGAYKTYKFGVRWFGDYRGALPGYDGASFCIDLRYWYPSKAFGYQERSAAGLKNRDGKTIPAASLRRMNYAAWTYGRTQDKASQGAVMLYVHGLMGDGAPGEVSPKAVGLGGTYDKVARAAARLAGPYKLTTSLPSTGTVGKAVKYSVKLTAASGAPVPGVDVKLDTTGARGAPAKVTTSANGTASVTLTPSDADAGLAVDAATEPLPSAQPRLFTPTKGAAVGSGQRLVVPAAEPVEARAATGVQLAQVKISTTATPGTLLVGEQTQDTVTAAGVNKSYRAPATVRLFGPARSADAITCDGPPAFEVQTTLKGGETMTPVLTPPKPGYYGYQLVVADVDGVTGVTTPCAEPTERIKVETQPRVVTQVSTPSLQPGAPLSDTLVVSGLSGESVPVQAALYGPFAGPDKLTCDGPPVWTGTVDAPGDGTYQTAATQLTVPGYYTYRESILATDLVRASTAPCGEGPETAIVRGAPQVRTQVSAAQAAPGSQLTDTVIVSGLGRLTADVGVELYGPFPSTADIRCDGTPFATSTLSAVGDGPHQTEPVTLGAAGYYTYRERVIATAAYDGTETACGEASETTFAKAAPAVTTVVSSAVVRPGASITDTINVTGAGATPLDVRVELFGPFRTRGTISCSGAPLDAKTVTLPGDGKHVSPAFKLPSAGFYTFRETVADAPTVDGVVTPCAQESETAFGAPLILTGRGDEKIVYASTPLAPKGAAPARVQAVGLGVDAKVYGIDVDPKAGVLAIPKDISRVGWWRDGASLGDTTGTVLLAGHVDSAARGAGAFYGLQRAKVGARVKVTDATGKVRTFRVTGRKVIVKDQIPLGIFTRSGPPKLVLVTCGGPFDQQSGHYRDNVIVTAVPV